MGWVDWLAVICVGWGVLTFVLCVLWHLVIEHRDRLDAIARAERDFDQEHGYRERL